VITLVTFDFWQTLFADTPEGLARAHALRLSGVREALGRAGWPYEASDLAAADTRAFAALGAIWDTNRDVTHPEQVRIFLAALDPALPGALSPADLAAVGTAYAAPVLTHPPVLSAGAKEAVRELGARGLRLGVISNTGRTPGTMLRRLLGRVGLEDGPHVLSFSDEVGARKPAAAIFEQTLARAGCRPREAVHVGDDAAADVAGALGVGMRAFHYAPDGSPGAGTATGVLRHFAALPGLLARL
jgi:putative hydrolase of the HAD superfamily